MLPRTLSLLAILLPLVACNAGRSRQIQGDSVRKAPILLPPEPSPPGGEYEFRTDFGRHTVPYSEILSGGPSRDGIPSIDKPAFETTAEAERWLATREPVIWLTVGGRTRAYPVQILIWHEIVNDVVGGVPVAVTYCPLCNSAIVFERKRGDTTLEFGTTGRLRFSNMVMYDRQTESWWQQGSGEAIAGHYAGERLRIVPASIISWGELRASFPDATVLSRATGFERPYGRNPYAGYDRLDSPHLYQGPDIPNALPPLARIVGVEIGDDAIAYPYTTLAERHVVNDHVGEKPIVIFWDSGAASPLDVAEIAEGRDVGAAVGFSREIDGQVLTFRFERGAIVDDETGSRWNIFGAAVEGPMSGKRLTPVEAINHFWFSWSVFKPGTRVYGGKAE